MPIADIIDRNVKLLICGEKLGERSHASKHYYADPRNRFWQTLHEVGLTDRRLSPYNDRDVLDYGIGLTVLIKGGIHGDGVSYTYEDRERLEDMIAEYGPNILAFTNKDAAKLYFERDPGWGNTGKHIHDAEVWIVPDPSGGNGHFRRLRYHWESLADAFRNLK